METFLFHHRPDQESALRRDIAEIVETGMGSPNLDYHHRVESPETAHAVARALNQTERPHPTTESYIHAGY